MRMDWIIPSAGIVFLFSQWLLCLRPDWYRSVLLKQNFDETKVKLYVASGAWVFPVFMFLLAAILAEMAQR